MADGRRQPYQQVYILLKDGKQFSSVYKYKLDAERTILPYLNYFRTKHGLSTVHRYYENSAFRIIKLNYED